MGRKLLIAESIETPGQLISVRGATGVAMARPMLYDTLQHDFHNNESCMRGGEGEGGGGRGMKEPARAHSQQILSILTAKVCDDRPGLWRHVCVCVCDLLDRR